MDFLNKKNLTHIIIFVFILLSLVHLFNMKDSIVESFITLNEDQTFASTSKVNIPSTDLVQFNAIGTSTTPNNLTTILNSKVGLDSNNTIQVPNIRAGKINMGVGGSPLRNTINCPEPMFISTTGDLTLESTTNVNVTGKLSVSGSINANGKVKIGDEVVAHAAPTALTRINDRGIQFGGLNAGREVNSAQISAGIHIADSLNIVGMSNAAGSGATRRVDMWAEGGFNVYGVVKASGSIQTDNAFITSINSAEGGAIYIVNPKKTSTTTVDRWTIFNMTDAYGVNALHFYGYFAGGTHRGSVFRVQDDGNCSCTGSMIVGGVQELMYPTSATRITAQGIIFGGANNGREANSAQISAGKHEADSLCLVGMSAGTNAATRKITMWAEGGLKVYGSATINTMFIDFQSIAAPGNNLYLFSNTDVHAAAKNGGAFWVTHWWGGSGNIGYTGGVYKNSDIRLKENINNITQNEKDKLLQLVPKTYNLISDTKKQNRFGLIAQEVEKLFPEFIIEDPKGMKSVNYESLIPLLLDQIKDLTNIINKTLPNPNVLNIGGVTLTANELLKLKKLINQ